MKTVIISLGGSLIVPKEIDTEFLMKFKRLIEKYVKQGYKFVIYCGGGSLARNYQKAYSEIVGDDQEGQDWIGISATYLNAFLLKAIFHEIAEIDIVEDPTKQIKFDKKILLAAGWKPGWSTDYDSVLLAKNLGIDEIINMTNIDYVYDDDPKKNKMANPIQKIDWKDFRKLVGNEWKAGLNMPFDPIAAKEAEKLRLKVTVLGKDIGNLQNYLENKKFKGTVIS